MDLLALAPVPLLFEVSFYCFLKILRRFKIHKKCQVVNLCGFKSEFEDLMGRIAKNVEYGL